MEACRSDAAAATRIVRRDGSQRRRGRDADSLRRQGRGDAAAATWTFRGDESRRRRGGTPTPQESPNTAHVSPNAERRRPPDLGGFGVEVPLSAYLADPDVADGLDAASMAALSDDDATPRPAARPQSSSVLWDAVKLLLVLVLVVDVALLWLRARRRAPFVVGALAENLTLSGEL